MARPVSDDRKKQFMKLSKEALVRFLLDEIKKNENLKEKLEKQLGEMLFDVRS